MQARETSETAAGDESAAVRSRRFAEAARRYSELGWALIPAHGKDPYTKAWQKTKPGEPGALAGEASHWGRTGKNLAVVLGPSKLAVLEADSEAAHKKLSGMLNGVPLNRVPRARGRRSVHHYFRDPGGFKRDGVVTVDGIELRRGKAVCIIPPSTHPETGNEYKWELEPFDVELLELPEDVRERFLTAEPAKGKAQSLDELIPVGKRRAELFSLAGTLRRRGLVEREILDMLRVVNETRCEQELTEGQLEQLAKGSAERYDPDPDAALTAARRAEPQPIDAVLDVFGRWLHLPDPGPVLVTCAAIAANRVESFDPTWLILVGAAGSGKTEALSATSGLDDVHVVATLTEAALLSGTPRKDTAAGASGGLLRELGESGIIVLKDFGSILSMNRDARAAVLAALRELFDGSWTRLVGVDGGRRLHWEGRVGLLAGATTVLDQHHAVMAQLGERFLIYRVAVKDAPAQGHSSLAHHGRERGMRRELAGAVAGLFAGLDMTEPPSLSAADMERLVSLAVLVARARSPVVRDSYRREIELVPDSEAPGRVVGALARLLTGLRMIGVDDDGAWRVTVKTGLDSMPAARRRALEILLTYEAEQLTTTDVAIALGLPNPTAHRVLEDLAAHGVIARESQGQGKADLWLIGPRTVELYRAATSSVMSEPPISFSSDNTYDDFSEEVPE